MRIEKKKNKLEWIIWNMFDSLLITEISSFMDAVALMIQIETEQKKTQPNTNLMIVWIFACNFTQCTVVIRMISPIPIYFSPTLENAVKYVKSKDVPLKLNRADVRVKCDVLENQVLNVMICLCWIFLVSSISFVQIVFLVFIFSNEHFCLSNSFFSKLFFSTEHLCWKVFY